MREKQVGQVVGRADAGMGIGNLPWIALHLRGEFLERLGREVVAHHEVERRAADQPDRFELERVVFDAGGIDGRRGGMAAHASDGQRVAVGAGLRTARAANGTAGAGDVLHDHALAERAAHMVGGDACQHVGRPARREHNDHIDRLAWKLLRRGRRRQQEQNQ